MAIFKEEHHDKTLKSVLKKSEKALIDYNDLGIVFTPEHIVELICDLVELKKEDKVFDPACGTGNILVVAQHNVNGDISNYYGCELREDLSIVAKSSLCSENIYNWDFMKLDVDAMLLKNFTVGIMNPPYSLAKSKETANMSELSFVRRLLSCLRHGARCAVIVPLSTMVGKTTDDKKIKDHIIRSHTLEGVISLNKNTFYGVGTNTCIAIFTAHYPHPKDKVCKFINFEDDGWAVSKHIGLTKTETADEKRKRLIDCWLHGQQAETKFMVQTPIEYGDEWLHSFYYFNDEIPTDADFEKTIADYLTFEFSMIMQGRGYLFENNDDEKSVVDQPKVASLFD